MMDVNSEKKSEPIYSISELIELLQLTRRTLLKYIKDRKLKAFKVGNAWRITQTQLNDFMTKHTN